MNIVNLTPHTLNIADRDGNVIVAIPPSGTVARIAVTRRQCGVTEEGIPLFITEYGEPEGLPDPQPSTIYVVSGMFLSHVSRPDLYQPGELVRDENGRPIACIGLLRPMHPMRRAIEEAEVCGYVPTEGVYKLCPFCERHVREAEFADHVAKHYGLAD